MSHLEERGVDNWEGYCHPGEIYEILINGKKHKFEGEEINYDEVVELAGKKKGVQYTITYSYACSIDDESGIMEFDDYVGIQDGTTFNVAFTGDA